MIANVLATLYVCSLVTQGGLLLHHIYQRMNVLNSSELRAEWKVQQEKYDIFKDSPRPLVWCAKVFASVKIVAVAPILIPMLLAKLLTER